LAEAKQELDKKVLEKKPSEDHSKEPVKAEEAPAA
jgi:hypothetical protein